jgi:hypothetical protein
MTLAKSYKTPKEFLKYLNKNQVRLKTSLGKTELQKIYKWAVDMSSKPSEWKKYISQ